VRLDVHLEAGLIREIACSVQGCVLCEVSALRALRQALSHHAQTSASSSAL